MSPRPLTRMRRCPVRIGLSVHAVARADCRSSPRRARAPLAPACTEWITPGPAPVRLLVYRSFPLDVKNADITRAVSSSTAPAAMPTTTSCTSWPRPSSAARWTTPSSCSPRFASTNNGCADKVAEREAGVGMSGPARWTSGGDAVGRRALRRLTPWTPFSPASRSGMRSQPAHHRAGWPLGRGTVRLALPDDQSGAHQVWASRMTYIVANPSSYANLDPMLPSATTIAGHVSALGPGYRPAPPAKPHPAFVAFGDADNCTTYDSWPLSGSAEACRRTERGCLGRSAEETALVTPRPTSSAAWTSCRCSPSTARAGGDGAGTDAGWRADWPMRAT